MIRTFLCGWFAALAILGFAQDLFGLDRWQSFERAAWAPSDVSTLASLVVLAVCARVLVSVRGRWS